MVAVLRAVWSNVRAAVRLLRVLVHVLGGVATVLWVFPRISQAQRESRVQAWAQGFLARTSIELVLGGHAPAAAPVLLVANHISWLDIVVIHAVRYCHFVSKSDVKHWPLIGRLATAAGTLFIERASRRDAMRVVHHMAQGLQSGEVLAVFPEGTTGDGVDVLPFHANLLQAAISADALVQPIALQFLDGATGRASFAPCYIGDDTLLASLWRTLKTDALQVKVVLGAPQHASQRDRRTWAHDLREEVVRLREEGRP